MSTYRVYPHVTTVCTYSSQELDSSMTFVQIMLCGHLCHTYRIIESSFSQGGWLATDVVVGSRETYDCEAGHWAVVAGVDKFGTDGAFSSLPGTNCTQTF